MSLGKLLRRGASGGRAVACVLVLVASLAPAASAQAGGGSRSSSSSETLSVVVRLVNVFFSVRDDSGTHVPGLTQADITVLEDSKPQQIRYFSSDPAGLTLALMIDTSPSQQRVLPDERRVGKEFLQRVIQPEDSALVASFDGNVRIVQEFTSDRQRLQKAMDEIKVPDPAPGLTDPHAGRGKVRGTIVRDAVHMIAEQKFAAKHGRKALVILTDGEDFGSQLDIQDAIRAAHLADVICYVLLVSDSRYYSRIGWVEQRKGMHEMQQLAKQTGGRLIAVGRKEKNLDKAFEAIAAELRHHYSFGYVSSNRVLDGRFRRLTVRDRKGHQVQVRAGYYALP